MGERDCDIHMVRRRFASPAPGPSWEEQQKIRRAARILRVGCLSLIVLAIVAIMMWLGNGNG